VRRPRSPGRPALAAAWLLAVAATLPSTSCSGGGPPAPAESTDAPPAAPALPLDEGQEPAGTAMRRLNVQIYYPSVNGDGLVGEPHEIFLTTAAGDRAKQILADLISGPLTAGALRALPAGTQLRQVYVLDNGTAFIDFSADLRQGTRGGSAQEILTVYSIVNSVALGVPEIRRVGILIDGKPLETLNGHLDLRRPLPPNPTLIVAEPAPSATRPEPRRSAAG